MSSNLKPSETRDFDNLLSIIHTPLSVTTKQFLKILKKWYDIYSIKSNMFPHIRVQTVMKRLILVTNITKYIDEIFSVSS